LLGTIHCWGRNKVYVPRRAPQIRNMILQRQCIHFNFKN
jgi:hypothetical protein